MNDARRLPLLGARTRELETCGYCPKLCRAACPVSNAEPRDSLTPWGKMSLSWFVARGELPLDREHAAVAWACTGCYACRGRCDHANPVAETLADARADAVAAGAAPRAALGVIQRHEARLREIQGVLAGFSLPGVDAAAPTALVVGCSYLRHAPDVARDAILATVALVGPVRLVDGCCGAPLLMAGDRDGFEAAQSRLLEDVRGSERLVVVDPGCAMALHDANPSLLVDLAVEQLPRLGHVAALGDDRPVRWHDPCQLGRGLGRYEEPRAVLNRVLGRAPEEFPRRRDGAACSGGGGLVPAVMPDVSARIAEDRIAEHRRAGGGVVVTGCASSLRRLSGRGAEVVDLATVIRQSLESDG